jgi:hypothetical protein
MGVQTFREDRAEDTEFMTISYRESVQSMVASPVVILPKFIISNATGNS